MQKILTPILWYGFALVFTKLFTIAIMPVLTAYLPPQEFGRLEVITSFIECVAILSSLAIGETVNRIAQDSKKRAALAGSALLIGSIMVVLVQVLLLIFARSFEFAPLSWVQASFFTATLTVFIELPLVNLRVENRAATFAFLLIMRSCAQFIGQYILLKNNFGAASVFYANAGVELSFALLLGVLQYKMTGFSLSREAFRMVFERSLPFMLGGLAMFIVGNADRWFLVGALPLEQIAFYGLALKFSLFVALFSHAFNMWWGPRKYQIYDQSPARARKIIMMGGALNCLGAFFVLLAVPVFVHWVLPPYYSPLLVYLPALVFISWLNETATLLSLGAFRAQTGLSVLAINASGAGVALLGYMALIPSYGIWGAIDATIAAHITRILLYAWVCQKVTPLFFSKKHLILA